MRKSLIASLFACLVSCGFATALDHWVYGQYNSQNVISNGVWMFRATVSGTNLTVGKPLDDVDPCQCPTNAVTPLDFSVPVIDGSDSTKQYTIIKFDTSFGGRASANYVGKLTLPGDGLTTISKYAFRWCSNLCGDLVFPSTMTSVDGYSFQGLKVTSLTFEASAGASVGVEAFTSCQSLTSVVFKAGGKWTLSTKLFGNCWGPNWNADLSGVIAAGGSSGNAVFNNANVTNITLNSDLVLTASSGKYLGGLLNNNSRLVSIRFTGAAPDQLDDWITGDSGFLSDILSSQSVTTIVPAEYRNVTNSSGKCWADYSASGVLNTSDSTWAAANVASGVDLSKRKLILDRVPDDDPPTITNVAASAIAAYQATVTVDGYGLNSGTIFVSLTNSTGTVTGPAELSAFGTGHTFTGLSYSTLYSVIAVATNKYGSVTNATYSFTTAEQPPQVSVEAGDNAYEKTCTAGTFTISRSVAKATALDVKYTMSGTATNGESYVTLSGTATIPANETSFTVNVTPLYNPYMKADATATMTISADSAYEITSGKGEASITVVDGGILGVSAAKGGDADYNTSQNGSFVISRASGDATVYPVTVKYSVGGTATPGSGYTALPATATIPIGSSSVTLPVVPLFFETNEETTVILTLTDDPTYTVGTPAATVTIAKVVAKHYSIAAGADPIGTTRGTFIVSRGANSPIDQKVTLTYTVDGAGANAIFPLFGTVVIAPYATNATIEVFANNASGSDAQLTVTIKAGEYTLDTASATITIKAKAQSEYWELTPTNTIVWGGWTFGVNNINTSVTPATLACTQTVLEYPSEVSTLDFSLPIVDANGKRYVLTRVGVKNTEAAKPFIGEVTLPGEGLGGFDYKAFAGCTNMTGTLVFPTTCTDVGGETFNNCPKLKILGRTFAWWTGVTGKENFNGVSFEGEVLAVSMTEVNDGGFQSSNIESVRFGPNLTALTHGDGRNGCFHNCSRLTNVVFDAASRVTLGNGTTFSTCTSLKSIDLSVVTNITCGTQKGTFYRCSALTNVIFGADLHYLASNVFAEAFDKTAECRSITFKGLPPEGFEMPYLSKLLANGSKGYPTVTTYVHRKKLAVSNAVNKCWLDYAKDGKIGSATSTWASDYLPGDVPMDRRPLLTIEPEPSGFVIIVR